MFGSPNFVLLAKVVVSAALLIYGVQVVSFQPGLGATVVGALLGYWFGAGESTIYRAYRSHNGHDRRRADDVDREGGQ